MFCRVLSLFLAVLAVVAMPKSPSKTSKSSKSDVKRKIAVFKPVCRLINFPHALLDVGKGIDEGGAMLRDARVNMVVQQSILNHGWRTSGASEISLIERHWTEEEWGSRKGKELQQLSDPPELLMNLDVPAGTSFSDGDHLRGNESDVIRFHHRKWMVLDGNNRRSGVDAAIASGKLDKKWCYPAVVVASVDPKDPLAIADLAGECNFVRSLAQHDTLLDRIRCLQRYMPVFKRTNPKGTNRGWRKDFVKFMLEETAVGANNNSFLGSAECSSKWSGSPMSSARPRRRG